MADSVRCPIGPLLGRAHQLLDQFYLPPTLRRAEESLDGLPERLPLDWLITRLHTQDDSSGRGTFFIVGVPGSGKTMLTQQVYARLLTASEPSPCALLNVSRLASLDIVPTDVRDLVIALRPNELHEEKWWKKQAKKGRIVVMIDAWNEIWRWAEDKPKLGRLLRALVFGNHRFNVVVTSRDDFEEESGLRTPECLLIEPLSANDTETFLVHAGLDPAEGMLAIQASGLDLAAENPLLLTLVIGLLRDSPELELPRTRAGLFERTLAEAERKLGSVGNSCREHGLNLGAALSGCSLLSLMRGTLTVRHHDLATLLLAVWPDQPVDLLIDALADKHLVRRGDGQFGKTLTLMHESLRDFGIALAHRGQALPGWVYCSERAEHAPADWVGLHEDTTEAASSVKAEAVTRKRFDLLIDVLMANGVTLGDETREQLWLAAGEGLIQERRIAWSVCERLSRLPHASAREAVRQGVLRAAIRKMPEAEHVLRKTLLARRLDGTSFQKIKLARKRGQLATGDRRGAGAQKFDNEAALTEAEVKQLTVTALRSSQDPNRRRLAANELGEMQAGFEMLLTAMQSDPTPQVRGAAARALGKHRDRSAVPALLNRLANDMDAVVRGSAATALGTIGDKAAMNALLNTLSNDTDPMIRGSAATALGAIGDKAAVSGLLNALLNDTNSVVRGSAATALGTIGDKAAVETLLKTLAHDSDPMNRGSAATALGTLGDKAAVEPLLKTLAHDSDPINRGAAATALGAIGDKAAVSGLLNTLKNDSDQKNRGSAAHALGTIGDRVAVDALLSTLVNDSDPRCRGTAAHALGMIRDKAAVSSLLNTLENDLDPNCRGTAANALGTIGDKVAVNALLSTLANDSDPKCRGTAANALGTIGDKVAVDALLSTLANDSDPKCRGTAANALGMIRDKAAVSSLLNTLENDADAVVRSSAAKALGAIEDKAAAPALKALLERDTENAWTKVTAISALLAVESDAADWLLAFAQRTKLAKEVRGRIVTGLTSAPPSPAAIAWLRALVWTDAYDVCRTEAVRGLAAWEALDEDTVRFALDLSYSPLPRNAKRPDWHVRGQVVGAILQARAARLPLGLKFFSLAVQHITAPEVPPAVIRGGLAPLNTLPLREAQTLFGAFKEALESVPPAIVPWLDRLRERITLDTRAETEFKALFSEPQALLRQFRTRVPTLLPPENATSPMTNPIALLITAVGAERKAVIDLLRDEHSLTTSREEIGGRYFNRFKWPGRKHTWDVLLAQPTEKGGPAAQALVQHFVQNHPSELKLVVMVGMCGGLPENGAQEGMVILARQVFNYEPARLREGSSAWSPTAYRSTARVLDLANTLAAEGDFGTIAVKTTKDYASGDKLIDDLGSELRQKIIDLSGDILGFEMEAPDVLHTAWELERTVHFDVAIAKGVSDFGDGKLRNDKEARQRLAIQNAMQVTLRLLTAY